MYAASGRAVAFVRLVLGAWGQRSIEASFPTGHQEVQPERGGIDHAELTCRCASVKAVH